VIRLGYPTQNLTIPASTNRTLRLANLSDPRQAGAHAYSVDSSDWQGLLDALDGRAADIMVEGKEYALAQMGVKIV